MDANRARLAELLNERRLELRLRWTDVSELAGVTRETLRQVRRGEGEIRELTKRGIETAMQWSPGSVDAILRGEKPSALTPASGFATYSEFPSAGVEVRNGGETVTMTAADTGQRVPSWFATEVTRRGLQVEALTLAHLRSIAAYYGYTLAELLLNAGLADDNDLRISERPVSQRGSEALAEFDQAMESITSSRFLSARKRREIEELIANARQEALEKFKRGR
ncbi:hypothetical protein Sme01_04250 [Sphaerisporangium melleum]|uniref:HTH cro/C1-type domain-containing protein n=1 Tax=Sphaerisporangium melleum TaxID=321316 RepID=A0A917QQM3_9ACTN|nr:hypothetical protein [Sphaerisporangium melleum]GGK62280.1 hypothetical protein GCM10007964_01800 [Sphaerisporangium melleum]GII67949.1 hypothetical protein Sme01_04250 [Sphaerisporangium melleum]